MAIHRAPRPDTHFTQVRNDVLRDERLSFRARGILATILSYPDDWRTTSDDLAKAGKEGRDAIQKAMKELETAGYLRRQRRQNDKGRWSTETVVYDTPDAPAVSIQDELFPNPGDVSTGTGFPGFGIPGFGKPGAGKPGPKNRTLLQNTVPTEQAPSADEVKVRPPADEVATVIYEAMDRMGNYMALRQVASKALKAGHDPEAVTKAMKSILAEGRPITGQTLWNALTGTQGATMDRTAHHDHWNSGGGFTAEEGPKP